jgi:hypothetical protein
MRSVAWNRRVEPSRGSTGRLHGKEELLASGVNAPAAVASALILQPVHFLFHDGASRELANHATTALFVPLLWYFIGRRFFGWEAGSAGPKVT